MQSNYGNRSRAGSATPPPRGRRGSKERGSGGLEENSARRPHSSGAKLVRNDSEDEIAEIPKTERTEAQRGRSFCEASPAVADRSEAARGDCSGSKGFTVAVRCRGLMPHEKKDGARSIVKVQDGKVVVLEDPQTTAADDYLRLNKSKERRYAFDVAFDESTGQKEVFEHTTKVLIPGLINGFNATVFAYGATGAGKTYTMLGNPTRPGIMGNTLQSLFAEVAAQREERHFQVKCSFLEVYNENIRDLLRPDGDYLDVREDPVKGMCVAGISEIGGLESASEIMSLLHQGNRNRTTEPTAANVTSSRSHAVLQVIVEQRDATANIVSQVNIGKLSMIDLAGSERASQTQNRGIRMIEGANINRSLLALGNCINALSSAADFVPYRDSKMTRLLKDSLGGNCRTVMIANCGPSHIHYEDTHNTLKYANRAKNIKTKVTRNVVTVSAHVAKYQQIIQDLRSEISTLKGKLAAEGEEQAVNKGVGRAEASELEVEENQRQSAKWKQELMQNFEERVRLKRELIDLAHQAQSHMVDRNRAQVDISQWESRNLNEENKEIPRPIRDMQRQLSDVKSDLLQVDKATNKLKEELDKNLNVGQRLQVELPKRVQNKDMRAFLGLLYRIHALEVENMELKEMNDMTEPLLHNKDLEAEALRLQIGLRDRMVEEHNELIREASHSPIALPKGWLACPQRDLGPLPKGDPSQAIAAADKVLNRVDEEYADEIEDSLGTSSGSRHHYSPNQHSPNQHSRSHSREHAPEGPASGSTPPPPPPNGSRGTRDEAHKPTGMLPPLPPGPRGRPADRSEPPARSRTPVGVALPDIRASPGRMGADARPKSLPFDGGPYAVRQAPSAVQQRSRQDDDGSGRRSSESGGDTSLKGLGARLGCRDPYRIPRSRRRKAKKVGRKDGGSLLFREYLRKQGHSGATVEARQGGKGPVPTVHPRALQAHGESPMPSLDRTQLQSGGVGAKDYPGGAPSSASIDQQAASKERKSSRLERLNRRMKTRPESLE